jgi:small-conductance mechanosensitive channel
MDSILLIFLPVIVAVGVSLLSSQLIRGTKFFARTGTVSFAFVILVVLGASLFVGSLLGLLLSLQINKIVFDYKVLESVLPSGVFLWYGFGPAPTPQFMSYWVYVYLVCLVALSALTLINFKFRTSRLDSPKV